MLKNYVLRNEKKVAWRIVDGEAVILVPENSTFHTLNTTGTRIWELADGKLSTDEIIQKICEEFKVEKEKVEGNIKKFITELVNKELFIIK
jgi:hypothetical protein